MDVHDLASLFTPFDAAAVAVFVLCWVGIGRLIEHPPAALPSVSVLMKEYRREWMRQMAARPVRIFDSNLLTTLRAGTSFFVSACLIAIGGGLALIGNAERLQGVADDLNLDASAEVVWEIKIGLALLMLSHAMLKFIWSHRLFGYCAVVMGAVPNEVTHPKTAARAAKAAEINITAALNFNRGMRGLYFALAALAWLLGPGALLVATALTLSMLFRREFRSESRKVLLEPTLDP